jgi:hypothetical protein
LTRAFGAGLLAAAPTFAVAVGTSSAASSAATSRLLRPVFETRLKALRISLPFFLRPIGVGGSTYVCRALPLAA